MKIGIAALAAAALVFAFITEAIDIRERMDAVTGSSEKTVIWPLGITFGPRLEASPLEVRLRKSGILWRRNWCFLHDTGYSALGTVTSRGCSTAPPIYGFRSITQEYVQTSTDAELRQFVLVMQTGTDAQQRAALQAAADEVLGRHDP
jgi:hypothetical protein